MAKTILRKKIEEYRREMISLAEKNDLTSEVVISSSMKLDKLINEYLRIT